MTHDVLHVRALPAEPLLRLDHTNPFVADAAARLAKADAVVIGSPVYKSAYTGLLKASRRVCTRGQRLRQVRADLPGRV